MTGKKVIKKTENNKTTFKLLSKEDLIQKKIKKIKNMIIQSKMFHLWGNSRKRVSNKEEEITKNKERKRDSIYNC